MTQHYDIAIIGGGIQGVGVAQAAAAAGYKTILFEQQQIASGTSSRSSKLIHGGLRYLESGQFSLVRKALKERALLLRLAPDLIKLVPFYIPVYRMTQRSAWQIRLGLSLYALLGRFARHALFKKTTNWSRLGGLSRQGLQVIYQYWDGQTDDAAITQAVMQSAMDLGASLRCPARVLSADFKQDCFSLRVQRERRIEKYTSTVLINAAGPWVNDVLQTVQPAVPGLAIDLVQGTHIVIKAASPAGIFYVEAPQDGRAVFIMPWQGKTMVGTTETAYSGDPAKVKPLKNEIQYLQMVYQYYFPDEPVDIVESFAGVRVLPGSGHGFFHRPRDTVLYMHENSPNLLCLYGGKLTSYRATAAEVMDKLAPLLPETEQKADTASIPLKPVKKSLC